MVSDLVNSSKQVWAFREKWGSIWRTPGSLDSLRYAYSEMGETYSEWMRERRSGDFRNREKEPEFLLELADTAIMLITALGPKQQYHCRYVPGVMCSKEDDRLLDYIAGRIGKALEMMDGSILVWDIYAYEALLGLELMAYRRGETLGQAIAHKLAKLEKKIEDRVGVHTDGSGDDVGGSNGRVPVAAAGQ